MSARIDFIPRLDGDFGGKAGVIDMAKLGKAKTAPGGGIRFDGLGQSLTTQTAIKKVANLFRKQWDDKSDKYVKDAATDFVTSGLKLTLGPGEDVRRGEDDPFVFVPSRGAPGILPNRNLLEPGMRTVAYKVRAPTGQASWVEPHAVRELLRAGYQVEEVEHGAHWYGIAWGYSIPEQWEAGHLNEDLLGERSSAATYALDDFRERVSGIGDSSKKLPGFFTLGDALLVAGGARFSGGTVTAVQMLQRLSAWEQIYMEANKERRPSGIVAPHSDRYAMQNTFFGTGGEGPSVWERAVDMFPWLNNVTWSGRMDTMSPTGTPRWVIYGLDRNNLYIEHTETLLFGPFEDRMDIEFVALRRHGGVVSKIPERVMFVDFA